eukprot:7384800-Ditylum_brightwellii.AAC.1
MLDDRQEQRSRRGEPRATERMMMRMESGDSGEEEVYSEMSMERAFYFLKCALIATGMAMTIFGIVNTPGPSSAKDLLIPPALRAAFSTQLSS